MGFSSADALYKREISENVIDIYWQGLENYDLKAVQKAFKAHTQNPDNGQFMPLVADVVRMLGGTTTDASVIAWSKVASAIKRVGPYQSVVFDDPCIHAAIEGLGGWEKVCATPSDEELVFTARAFENLYKAHKRSGSTPDYQRVLIGITERVNADLYPHAVSAPVMIGDKQMCQLVFEGGSDQAPLQITRSAAMSPKRLQLK
jgi:hypothetical protein